MIHSPVNAVTSNATRATSFPQKFQLRPGKPQFVEISPKLAQDKPECEASSIINVWKRSQVSVEMVHPWEPHDHTSRSIPTECSVGRPKRHELHLAHCDAENDRYPPVQVFSEKTYRLFKLPDLPYVSEEKTERSRLRQAASDVWEGSSASSGCFQTGRVVLTHKQRSSD